jgi:hypothetical protein
MERARATILGMARASSSEREYFARVARENRELRDERAPASLAEMFDRLAQIRRSVGTLARPGVAEAGDGDLAGHLAFLERVRAVERRGARRP